VTAAERAARRLGLNEAESGEWLDALKGGPKAWMAEVGGVGLEGAVRPVWLPSFVGLARREVSPGTGVYRMDVSSVFMAVPFLSLQGVGSALDVCAAPGGKTVLCWQGLRPERLVANEADPRRAQRLADTMRQLNVGAQVCRLRPDCLEGEFDLVILDAPCSGQALLAKGRPNPGCFHPSIVNGCAMRQRRLLAISAARVRPGGHLAYMTCTFSLEENEGAVSWFLARRPGWKAVPVDALAGNESRTADFPCYRDWPHRGLGAGGFTALLRRGP
jgi:16S rRNA C967 or C1407 C5-methylase (RsmB/RsmF family)